MASQPRNSRRFLPRLTPVLIALLLLPVPAGAQEPDDTETLIRLTHIIEDTDLSDGIRTSFLAKVDAALRYVTDGTREDAVDVLTALKHQVHALTSVQGRSRRCATDLRPDRHLHPAVNKP